MNTGGTQAGGTRDLPDGQTSLFGRDNGPDPFVIGVGQPRGREAESGNQLLFATDTLSPCVRGFHTPEHGLNPTLLLRAAN